MCYGCVTPFEGSKCKVFDSQGCNIYFIFNNLHFMLQIHSDSHRLIYKVDCGTMSWHKDSRWGYKKNCQYSARLWTGGEDNNRPRTRICEWGTAMHLKLFIFPHRIFVIESYCVFQGNLHTLIFLQVNRGVLETLGVKHCITSAYRPTDRMSGQTAIFRRHLQSTVGRDKMTGMSI